MQDRGDNKRFPNSRRTERTTKDSKTHAGQRGQQNLTQDREDNKRFPNSHSTEKTTKALPVLQSLELNTTTCGLIFSCTLSLSWAKRTSWSGIFTPDAPRKERDKTHRQFNVD